MKAYQSKFIATDEVPLKNQIQTNNNSISSMCMC